MSPATVQTRDEWSARLAQALIEGGYETESNLRPLVNEARATDQPLATLLISRHVAIPGVVVGALAHLAQMPAVDLMAIAPSPELSVVMSEDVAREFGALPLRLDGNVLAVAFAEPPSPEGVDSLAARVGYRISPVLADPVVIGQRLGSAEEGARPAAVSDLGPAPSSPLVGPDPAGDQVTGEQVTAAPEVSVLLERGLPSPVTGGTMPLHIDDLLRYAVSVGASDLHLTAQMPGSIRLHGAIRSIEGCPPLDNELIRNMVFGILPASQRERFEAENELDTSHSIAGVGRFRVNVSMQRGTVAAALRPIPHEMPEFDTLGLPDAIKSFTDLRRGLVLVTGPTGSGKSTTLASLVDIINRTKPLHIVTVEDPIEFLHDHKRSIITQREVGEDTASFSEALRRVLRQDPDVILVGELRDLETISMALTAAETGHLVFGTLHTQDCPQTVDRMIDVFPTNQQEQIRVMLAATLQGVVTQQLIVNSEGTGRVPCSEVLVCTSAIRNLIRQSKTHQIYSLMQVGGSFGMQTMDQGLAKLVQTNVISEGIAYDRASNEEDLRNHLNT
ncbi:MAG: PilT/PilU family type 4a pilus ATPase [Acidimicrobiales bacterium]|jgi:twitching motility protein PilT